MFVDWLNLDIGIDVCFFDGLDAYTKTYGGPEGPCPLPDTIFPITNFDFSHYQLPIWLFLVSNFEFSHY